MKIIHKYKLTIIIVIILVAGVFFLNDNRKEPKQDLIIGGSVPDTYTETQFGIYVHIEGAVRVPGVYRVLKGQRLFEVIEKAGGLIEEAYTDNVNLAGEVNDGQKIIIYTIDEWQSIESDSSKPRLVNINTADADMLMTLPGIGKTRADAIISYRNKHGLFNSIEDIMNVSGIKTAAFEKIKDYICV